MKEEGKGTKWGRGGEEELFVVCSCKILEFNIHTVMLYATEAAY